MTHSVENRRTIAVALSDVNVAVIGVSALIVAFFATEAAILGTMVL